MYIHGILDRTTVNGPGARMAIWTAGCTLKCPGCWNPDTHQHGSGTKWSTMDLAQHILCYADGLEGITFSGGEPLQQIQDLLAVVDYIRFRRPHLTIGLYTGYTRKELEAGRYECFVNCIVGSTDPADCHMLPGYKSWWETLSSKIDFAVMGRFNQDQVSKNLPLRGSANQELVLFSKRYTEADFGPQMVEITIAPGGKNAVLTGFPIGMNTTL